VPPFRWRRSARTDLDATFAGMELAPLNPEFPGVVLMAVLLSVKRLENFEVYDRQGNKLGAIDDLMLDVDAAKVRYAVLAAKFGIASSARTFAVPLRALRLDTENECFVLDVDRDRLESADGFDAAAPPVQPDPLFAQAAQARG
jgi:sporulation protein YlmC with PRC-barrel domain